MKPDHYGQKDVAPMAKHLARANEARVPFWKREWYGVPRVLWVGLAAVGGFALYLHFKFPPF